MLRHVYPNNQNCVQFQSYLVKNYIAKEDRTILHINSAAYGKKIFKQTPSHSIKKHIYTTWQGITNSSI